MKKILIITIIIMIIIMLTNNVYAVDLYQDVNIHNYPYYIKYVQYGTGRINKMYFEVMPLVQIDEGTGKLNLVYNQGELERGYSTRYIEEREPDLYLLVEDDESYMGLGFLIESVIYCNFIEGFGIVDLQINQENKSFFGIDFNYSGFFGDLKVQLGKKEESGTYKTIKEWQYPKGTGYVSIPASEIPQGNKGEYMITIYEGDTIINQYPYVLNVDKESYCEINYPVNGQDYDYYPNVNIQYYNMGRLYIYINGEMYKQIQTDDREGVEVIDGRIGLFDIGSNTVAVMDSNGHVVATVQYMVMREGSDFSGELSEFEAESWVQELFNRIMNEYSLFFEYVKSMYAFLPVEIVGLVGVIMMLSVILWFTGRK